jgi:hypothetical protein
MSRQSITNKNDLIIFGKYKGKSQDTSSLCTQEGLLNSQSLC